jgi:hypothetical protein
MRWKAVLGALARAVLVLAAGCTSSSSQAHKAYTSSSSSQGVQCVVVNDKAWDSGNLIERTYDWFALR